MEWVNEEPTSRSIWLWNEGEYSGDMGDGFKPWLDPYPIETDRARGAVLVCPGGGYENRAPHEAGIIAKRFNSEGYHAFVVHYSVAPRRHPQPLKDVSRAIRIIRSRASEWKVDPDHIAVCGFSAGGHLTGSIGVHYDKDYLKGNNPLDSINNRPDALILCYPVISSGKFANEGSFMNLLGDQDTPEVRREMSLELQVNENTPPAFLWHTVSDDGVPVENSILFASALRAHGVGFEMHLYPVGQHGLGLAEGDPHIATWAGLCGQWLKGLGF
ncbi:MAG: alpha/beta hydrolase [Armatimonadota bacterium]